METFKRTPLQLFNLPQNFVIPLFQRPYVWKEVEQWEPLWKDIRRVAELRIAEPHLNATHFLGAVVIQSHEAQSKRLTTWNVIDGQQRLTTLQVLADATRSLLAQANLSKLAGQLEDLTHNSEKYVEDGDSPLKLRHLNKDREPFDELMTADSPIDYEDLSHSDSQLVAAHQYFSTVVEQWLGIQATDEYLSKAKELTSVLLDGLQLVSIELEAAENSQEIFETLNARGTPLTAADLVRNFVFQRLDGEGADTKKAYREDWPFETKFWMREVSVGRNLVSRSSLFLNQWLVARTGEEVSPQATFYRFKSWVELESGQKMADLLPAIKHQAQLYQAWTEDAAQPGGSFDSAVMAFYRMRASGVEVLKPLLIWLYEPGRNLPQETIDRIVQAAGELGVPSPDAPLVGQRFRTHCRRRYRGQHRRVRQRIPGASDQSFSSPQCHQHVLARGRGGSVNPRHRGCVLTFPAGQVANVPRGHRGPLSRRDWSAAG